MKLNSFIKECSEKEVFKMLSIYIVSSWVLIQVLSVIWQPLAIPAKSIPILIIILLIGLPIYIYILWRVRLAPYEKEKDLTNSSVKGKGSKFQKMYFSFLSVIIILVITSVSLIANNAFYRIIELPELQASSKIGILNFGNNTGKSDFDIVGKMSADWISHGITENKLGQVISPELVSDYISILKASEKSIDNQSVLKEYFKPSKVITGNFYLSGTELLFQSSITDGDIDKTLISFKPIKCDASDPLACIEAIKQMVLGYLISEEKGQFTLEQSPPKYKAYSYLLDANTNYSNNELYLELLNKAILEDSNYFEPKVMRVGYYYNYGEYAKSDSLRRLIIPNSKTNKRQLNLLNHYGALLGGNSRQIYSTLKKEYNYSPYDLQTNATAMTVAVQFVNRPIDVDSIFAKISMDKMDIANCTFCQFRSYIQALANLELKKYDEVVPLLIDLVTEKNELYLKRPIMAAYIRSDNLIGLEDFLKKQEIATSEEDIMASYLFVGKEFLLKNNLEKSAYYFSKIDTLESTAEKIEIFAEAAYFLKDYKTSEKLYKTIFDSNPEDYKVWSKLATSFFKNGKLEESKKMLDLFVDKKREFQYGRVDYCLAQFYASINDSKNALKYLLISIADGNLFLITNFQNDPHFTEYVNMPEFRDIMSYWH